MTSHDEQLEEHRIQRHEANMERLGELLMDENDAGASIKAEQEPLRNNTGSVESGIGDHITAVPGTPSPGPSGSEYETATESTPAPSSAPATIVQEEQRSDVTRIQSHNLSVKQAIYLSFIANARIRWALEEEGTTTKKLLDGLEDSFQKDKSPPALPNLELHHRVMEAIKKDEKTHPSGSMGLLKSIGSNSILQIVRPENNFGMTLGHHHDYRHDYGAHDYCIEYSGRHSVELQLAWGCKLNVFLAIDFSLKKLKCEVDDVSRALTEVASLELHHGMNNVLKGPIRTQRNELNDKLRILSEMIETLSSYEASLVKIETEWADYKKAYDEAFDKLENANHKKL